MAMRLVDTGAGTEEGDRLTFAHPLRQILDPRALRLDLGQITLPVFLPADGRPALAVEGRVQLLARPERRDPPTRLLNLALEIGCDFSIDTDAHAPGQLDFLGYGAQRALDAGVPVERIVNTWPAEQLLEWTASVG